MKFKFYGKEFNSEEIDYIRYKSKGYMLEQSYFFVVSINGQEKYLGRSSTKSQMEIWGETIILKQIASRLGLYPANSIEGGAIINVLNADELKIKKTFLFNRYYFEARYKGSFYDDGRIFKTSSQGKKQLAQMEKVLEQHNHIKQEKEKQKRIEKEKEEKVRNEYYEKLIKKYEMDEKLRQAMEEYNVFVEEEYEK